MAAKRCVSVTLDTDCLEIGGAVKVLTIITYTHTHTHRTSRSSGQDYMKIITNIFYIKECIVRF